MKVLSDFHPFRCLPPFLTLPSPISTHISHSPIPPSRPQKYPGTSALGDGSSGVVGTGVGISTCGSSFSPTLRAGRHISPSLSPPLESLLSSCWLLAAGSWVLRWFAHELYILWVLCTWQYIRVGDERPVYLDDLSLATVQILRLHISRSV